MSHDVAAKRRATRWWGVDIGDLEIVLWGSPIEFGSQDSLARVLGLDTSFTAAADARHVGAAPRAVHGDGA